jgi:hypothetical protein
MQTDKALQKFTTSVLSLVDTSTSPNALGAPTVVAEKPA